MTDVMFRTDNFETYAIFPKLVFDCEGRVTVYARIGQHSSGDLEHMLETSRPATLEEYESLLHELVHLVGYDDLHVVQA